MKSKTILGVVLILAAILVGVAWLVVGRDGGAAVGDGEAEAVESAGDERTGRARPADAPARRAKASADDPDDDSGEEAEEKEEEADEPMTEEEKREAEEEARVEAFDALTDKWSDPTDTPITMADVDAFAAAFRKVPAGRRDECVHRALNLVPDENVMLLAGILMDKEMDKEIVETVFNDVLNRDEDVKAPILRQIFKDKSHPCWTDTAWVLDATDSIPSADGDKQ